MKVWTLDTPWPAWGIVVASKLPAHGLARTVEPRDDSARE